MSGPSVAAAPATRSPMIAPLPEEDTGAGIPEADLHTLEELAAGGDDTSPLAPPPYDHDENLAMALAQSVGGIAWMDRQGTKIRDAIEADLRSRAEWERRFKRGLEIIGLTDFVWDKGVEPFEGASTAIAPVLATAIVQSQARFMEEIFPAEGPVKTVVMGKETPQKRDSADRVQQHMNYQLTMEDDVYFMESQKLGLYLPIFGCGYRKAYHDFVTDSNVLRFVPGEDLIMPYSARNLSSSPRVSHRFQVTSEEFAEGRAAGAYRDVELQEEKPGADDDKIQNLRDKVDSVTEDVADDDVSWTFYECDLRLDIPGYEDVNGAGVKTKLSLHYTVTLEKVSGKIVAIRRNWDKEDHLKLRCTRYAEYWYLPGLGCYGTGLIHWIGTIAEAATDSTRALLDSATWANLQGGFKAKDSGAKAGELHMRPGAWIDVDMTADELANAFHTPPVKEPSEALFKLLGFLTEQAAKFASTTDLMVGDSQAKGAPVGTTLAMIEQGSKVYSGVHKRAHFAAGIEFRMLFDLNSKYIPDGGYPYQVPGDDVQVFREDYSRKIVNVVPVSDPNIFSQTQRIALAQSRYQLYKENPGDFRKTEVLRGLLRAFKDPDIDNVLIDFDDMPDVDPVSENVAISTGHPAKAKEGQNHDAHLLVHMSFMQHPQFGGLPQAAKLIGPAMTAHIAEHLGLKYADTMRKLGVPVGQQDLTPQAGAPLTPSVDQTVPPDEIAAMAAQQVQAFMQQSGLTTTPPGQDQTDPLDDDIKKSTIFKNIATGAMALAKAGETFNEAAGQAGNVDDEMKAGAAQP